MPIKLKFETLLATLPMALMAFVWHPAGGAESVLSPEAQLYANQDPSAALARLLRPHRADRGLTILGICPALPVVGVPGVTSPHHYFLSEIGGCAQLHCFLRQVNTTANAHATLVVDQNCTGPSAITRTLVMPNRFTLAGVGIDGEGVLEFQLPNNVPAIRFSTSQGVVTRMSTIRDLNLAGNCCGQVGIDVSNSQYVFIKNVRMQNFAVGIWGDDAYSVFIDQSSLHGNALDIAIGEDTTAWRVRDTGTSQALMGIHMGRNARGHLVSGGRIEGNRGPGIQIEDDMNVVENTWLEGNGSYLNTLRGVHLTATSRKNRILGGLFSSQIVHDEGVENRKCFNMSFTVDSADVNDC